MDPQLVPGLPPTVRRKILSTGPKCSLAEMHVAQGTRTPTHHHPHAAVVYLLEGSADMRLDGQRVPMVPGDALFIDSGAEHGFAENAEDLVFLEFFVPGREDF